MIVANVFSDIEKAEDNGQYTEKLDSITFNDGFAHLVSYKQQEIDTVSWDGDQLEEIYNNSRQRMSAALQESNTDEQEKYIYDARFGGCYDKYAAMCEMIYLGRQRQSGGNKRLKELFYRGYRGFASKSIPY